MRKIIVGNLLDGNYYDSPIAALIDAISTGKRICILRGDNATLVFSTKCVQLIAVGNIRIFGWALDKITKEYYNHV